MHAEAIVTRVLGPVFNCLHAKRQTLLKKSVCALIRGGVASLSAIARSMQGSMALRYRVKSVDRLLGNPGIRQMREALYRQVAHHWLAGLPQVLIVVDWSDVTRDQQWQQLRASVALQGRSITLYEEVHPRKHYGNRAVQGRFLQRLTTLLPPGCAPVVMADAGFRVPWCQQVAALGWQWIVRVRHRDMVRGADGTWDYAHRLHAQATGQARDYGPVDWVRRGPMHCRLVTIKRPAKGRQRSTLAGKKSRAAQSLKQSKREREPWVLVSSLGLAHLSAQAIVNLYAQRMQIEQTFRDTKNISLGLGLSASRSRSDSRFEILLLLVHLALFVLHVLGQWARDQQLELQFQSTNSKRREISAITLARRLLENDWPVPKIPLRLAFDSLRKQTTFGWQIQ